jgi:chitodextrinase
MGYRVESCQGAGCSAFVEIAAPKGTSYSVLGLAAATSYRYRVRATDAAGNLGSYSIVASATTASAGSGDTTRPSTPANLTAAGAVALVNLSWDPSTDNVGVIGYIVRRNGIPVATPVTTSYTDTGLSAGTTYRYTVAARDAAGTNSFLSKYALATTAGAPPVGGIPSTLGWYQIPGTQLSGVCAATHGFSIPGIEGCPAITASWSGGTFDTTRNRLLMWGGGHGAYAGNEVYALELDTLTMVRLNDPSTSITDGCVTNGVYPDGKPVSRHTYNHLAYLPNQDVMFAWGGSRWQCGYFIDDAWFFSLSGLSGLSWTKKSSTNGPVGSHFGVSAAYDPDSGLIYAHDGGDLFSYDPSADTWTKRSSRPLASGFSGYAGGVIDPVRKRYYLHGRNNPGTLYWYDISSPTASVLPQSGSTTGCSAFIGNYEFGMEYDPIQDKIVGWHGGNTIYVLDPDALSCATVPHSGGPAANLTGTFGRFRYSPSLNVFAVCNSVNDNCYSLRLTP